MTIRFTTVGGYISKWLTEVAQSEDGRIAKPDGPVSLLQTWQPSVVTQRASFAQFKPIKHYAARSTITLDSSFDTKREGERFKGERIWCLVTTRLGFRGTLTYDL